MAYYNFVWRTRYTNTAAQSRKCCDDWAAYEIVLNPITNMAAQSRKCCDIHQVYQTNEETMGTQALARFGVYGLAGSDERKVLALADAYRRELCDLYHEQHRATLNLRELRFPGLFAAMVRREQIGYSIFTVEKAIKKFHSEVRDRNAVPADLRDRLRALRAERTAAKAEIARIKPQWISMIRDAMKMLGDKKVRKDIKSISAREELYANINWPPNLQEYGAMWIGFDMRRRRLRERYQSLGLHYAIRGEIDAATKPKLLKDGPGMRYFYSRWPEPRLWEKITLQFGAGGLDVPVALSGTEQFSIKPVYTNSPVGGDETVVEVVQQIGNSEYPCLVTYRTKLHKPLPGDATLQRWTLIVRSDGQRECVPTVSGLDFVKPSGSGMLTYDLTWTVVPNGVRVCRFVGDHVNETLVIPKWLVANRMAVKPAQELADNRANELLEQRGISRSKTPGPKTLFGVSALAAYYGTHPEDQSASNELDQMRSELSRAQKTADRALRCIEKIYETVARRVCRLHDKIVPDNIDLSKIKRYDTRDLLREDVLPPASREIMFAVAPGKLKALLNGYGLASVDVAPESPFTAPDTNLFTSYVKDLGIKTGAKSRGTCRRLQNVDAAPKRIVKSG